MSYKEYVYEEFREHQSCMGVDWDEIEEIIEETPFSKIERFLIKSGYNLKRVKENYD